MRPAPAETLSVLAFELILSTLLSWGLTEALRRYAIRAEMLDHPNERGSHRTSTPRGGGLAIAVVFAAGASLGSLTGSGAMHRATVATVVAGMLVAAIGWWDDRRGLPARVRFLVHGAAGALLLIWAGWPELTRQSFPSLPSGIFVVLGLIYLVWMTNLFNFMDGIDGIAAVEAITVCVGGALCCWLVAPSNTDWRAALLLAACCLGFLIVNYPPARIFMGDVGSGFVGFCLGALALMSLAGGESLPWSWLILTAAFMTDATVTLIRRVLRGEKFYLAHRSHAYQYASRLYKSHKVVTLAFGAINVFWLFPWALAVALGWIDGVIALVIAYIPLVLLVFHYKAGDRAGQGDLA